MAALTPEERALAMLAEQKDSPERITLEENGDHGVEFYKIPWPDSDGNMHITYCVKGDKSTRAEMQPGGKEVHVTIQRSTVIRNLIQEIRYRFADKLTNPKIASALACFESMFTQMLNSRAFRQNVSRCLFVWIEFICLD